MSHRDIERRFIAFLATAVDVLHRPVDDGERAQTEKVELDQADGLDVVLVELGDHALPAFFTVQRAEIGQHGRRDHHAAGVFAGVARQAFQRQRHIDDAR